MPWGLLAACTFFAIGCSARRPAVIHVGGVEQDIERFVRDHPLPAGAPLRADAVLTGTAASHHVVQVADRETPHVHRDHDLLVVVWRGRGRLHLADRVVALSAGDVVQVPRNVVHWYVNEGAAPSIAFVTFTPPLVSPDSVPVAIDSDAGHR